MTQSIVCLMYQIEDERNDDDSGWRVGRSLSRIWANEARALRWLKQERLRQLRLQPIRINQWDNSPRLPYQYRARKDTYNLVNVWVLERAPRGENQRWMVLERYALEKHGVSE